MPPGRVYMGGMSDAGSESEERYFETFTNVVSQLGYLRFRNRPSIYVYRPTIGMKHKKKTTNHLPNLKQEG